MSAARASLDELRRLKQAVERAECTYNHVSGAAGADELLCDAAALDAQAAALRLRAFLKRQRVSTAGKTGEKGV